MAGNDIGPLRGRKRGSYTVYYSRRGPDGGVDEYTDGGDIYEDPHDDGGRVLLFSAADGGGGWRAGLGDGGAGRVDGGAGRVGGGAGRGRGSVGGSQWVFGDGLFGDGAFRGRRARDVTPPRHIYFFSERELDELGWAVAILTLAFALAFVNGIYGLFSYGPYHFLFTLFIAFVVVSTGFVLHELGHKFVAQRYGCWAEFRYSKGGLVLALVVSGLFGFLFAAPGAVMISGHIDRRQNGIISLAGPATNLALAYGFIGLLVLGAMLSLGGGGALGGVVIVLGVYGTMVNLILGGFNMIPLPPFDGSKIITWSPMVYIALAAAIGGTFIWFLLFFMV